MKVTTGAAAAPELAQPVASAAAVVAQPADKAAAAVPPVHALLQQMAQAQAVPAALQSEQEVAALEVAEATTASLLPQFEDVLDVFSAKSNEGDPQAWVAMPAFAQTDWQRNAWQQPTPARQPAALQHRAERDAVVAGQPLLAAGLPAAGMRVSAPALELDADFTRAVAEPVALTTGNASASTNVSADQPSAVRTSEVLATVPVNKGAQPLVQALAQKIQYQQVQGADVATVRLDPPQMGSLEIRIRHDANGAVHVQMHASNAEVGRQLTTLVENLRQELQQRSTDAQVTVASSRSAGGGMGQGASGEQAREQAQQGSSSTPTTIGQALQSWDGEALT